jgi:outer membrane immunogenic protein
MMGSTAIAADVDYSLPAAPAMDWTGFWLGGQVGYLFGDVDIAGGGSFDVDGAYLGVAGGYDWQFDNNVVAGVFVTAPIAAFADGTNAGATVDADVQWAAALGLRLGFAFDNFLPYVMGGLVVGQGEGTVVTTGASDDQMHTGYHIGAGLDYLVDENWTVGAYYSYQDLGSETYNITGTPPTIDFTSHTIALTVGYRF